MTSSPAPLQSQMNTTASSTTPWSFETNWTVSRGCLHSAVTLESFDFPIDSQSTPRKPPLILVPPSPSDFEPCEIKLNFSQKHEIRQVYIKSTARVYEIYYAPALHSENEYLCTVRCSAASTEEDFYPETDVKEASPVNLEGLNEISPKGRVGSENNVSTNEEDWVEVKHPVGRVDETYMPHQNYYEATAEINDSDPCMSLTLRLLSLQTKGCVYINEVYVFADTIETDDSESPTINTENSSGNSLMSMLVPTLLGLSKSRSLQSPNPPTPKPVIKSIEPQPQPSTSTNPVNLFDSQSKKLLKNEIKSEGCDLKTKNTFSDSGAESLLEQLVSRVTRLEDICLRFEENIMKPINSMESRLQRVEQQVELLVKNSEYQVSSDPVNDSQLCGESESLSCEEKVQVNDVLESPKEKKSVSIDDALAAALAGFSSFTKDNNDSFLVEEECLNCDQLPIKTSHESNTNSEASISSESPKSMEDNEANDSPKVTSRDASRKIPDDIFQLQETPQVYDEENYETKGESIKVVKVSSFDKSDILKYFPNQSQNDGCDSSVDFETPILEVKFASMENDTLESHLKAFRSISDDPVTDDAVSNVDENTTTANNLLVELDGDCVQEQDLPLVQHETSFASLI